MKKRPKKVIDALIVTDENRDALMADFLRRRELRIGRLGEVGNRTYERIVYGGTIIRP